jgi:hypothetical protein
MPEEQEQPREIQLEVVAASALESLERASVDIQISTAHKYPRSLTVVKRRMMDLATLDEETAESCFYKLNRQGKSIEGPSIRLAEIAASSFGNLRYGARVIANDGKQITAQGFCHDLESNVMSTIEVKRRITDRNGRTYSDDMQVVTGNAACAIAARNSIFKVVPFAFVKPIFLAAKKTAVGDITTLAERRTKMLAKFAAFGVNEKRVCASVGKAGVDEIGLSELEDLIGVHNAIRDNEQTVDEAFPEERKPIVFGAAAPEKTEPEEPKPSAKKKPEKPAPPRATALEGLRNLMAASKIGEPALLTYLFSQNLVQQGEKLETISDDRLTQFINNWMEILPDIQKEA